MEDESNLYVSVMKDMKKMHTVDNGMMQRGGLKSNALLGKIASIKVLSFLLCSAWESTDLYVRIGRSKSKATFFKVKWIRILLDYKSSLEI